MTSYQLAHRLLRHCTPGDPAALSLSQAMELAGAISAGLGIFFRYAPATMRQTSSSATLDAPTTKTGLSITANGLAVNSGSPFTIGHRGCSILIEGDGRPNEIVSTTGWLNAYQGTTGTKTATLYGDCIPVRSTVIERLVSDPWILLSNGQTEPLKRFSIDEEKSQSFRSSGITTGRPTRYAISETGVSRDSDTHFLLRVWPAPAEATVLRFEADIQPDIIDETNIVQVPVDLPLSPVQTETMLVPLCERELLRSTFYKEVDGETRGQIAQAALRAEAQMKILPANKGQRRGRVGTPRGW